MEAGREPGRRGGDRSEEAYPSSPEGLAGAGEWVEVREDCCKGENGGMPPTVHVYVHLGRSGGSLKIRVRMFHWCGIDRYELSIGLIPRGDPGAAWDRTEKGSFSDTEEEHWASHRYGPGEAHGLPINLVDVLVVVTATVHSRCQTVGRDGALVILEDDQGPF